MTGVVTLGETMGLFTAVGTGLRVDAFHRGIGGAESNLAIGLARLGTEATWIGRIGADGTGELILRELRAEGVTPHAIVDDGAATGLMIKTQPVAGRSRVEYHRQASAGSRLRRDDLDPALIRGADLLHVTGITPALSPSAADAIETAVDLAVAAGVPVSFDVNHRSRLWDEEAASAVYRDLARRATIVFAGVDEAELLVGRRGSAAGAADAAELAEAIADLGPTQVLVKLGPDGCIARIDGEQLQTAAIPVDVVDTVGAGDAFAAGYLAELLAGRDARARLALAVRAGAFACLGPGDWESLPRRADLDLLDGAEPVIR